MKLFAVLLCVLIAPLVVVDGLKPQVETKLSHQSTSRFKANALGKCMAPLLPSVGAKGYAKTADPVPATTMSACAELVKAVDQKICTIEAKNANFACNSPGKCDGTAAKFALEIAGDKQLLLHQEPDVAGCMGAHKAEELKISTIVLKDDKLLGATATGTYKYVDGQSTSFTVTLDNNYFDCSAFERSTAKLEMGYNANANAGLLETALEAQADFIGEVQYTLAREFGLKFNGLTVTVTIEALAQAEMKASLSLSSLEAKVGVGTKMAATGNVAMKYFGATGKLNVGAYAEAGILVKFDDDWNFAFDLDAGCLFGASFKMQLAVGDMAYDAAAYVTGSKTVAKGAQTMAQTWSDSNSPFQQSEGDVEYKADVTMKGGSQ